MHKKQIAKKEEERYIKWLRDTLKAVQEAQPEGFFISSNPESLSFMWDKNIIFPASYFLFNVQRSSFIFLLKVCFL